MHREVTFFLKVFGSTRKMPAVKLEGKERPGFLSKHPQRVEYLWSVDTLGLGIVEIPISGADPESDKP